MLSSGACSASCSRRDSTRRRLAPNEFDVVGQSRIQARFSSRLLRFVDDVTFYVREDGMVEVRSASRVGYWDLGANRRRVESLREQLAEQAPDDSTSQHYPQHGSRSLG